ncbi:MAG TPA: hypothetical protein VN872_10460, partial [Candidatus Acidoferrum sp.]|nr:hypothetical protein [Candidatus Acidoferrum sp.]
MPDSTPASYSIVPWVRRGLASLITAQPATNYASLPVTLKVNTTPVNAPAVRLIGPGQITGLDARAVVRTDPRNRAATFEPNYLAMVELALPDLPWMFTPSPPVNGKLQPWICLVVVPDADGIVIDSLPGGVSLLHIKAPFDPKAELPDLATISSWVHAQVTGASLSGNDLKNALQGNPAAAVSRLVASRKLEANKSYIACIVPTYRAGVNAALGLDVDDHDLLPAWDANVAAPFVLPAYYVFRFHTGPEGDFASLARKIVPPAKPLDAGTRTMDVSQPGFGANGVAGGTLGLEGALRAFDNQPTPWSADAQAKYESQFRAALAPPAAADPVVAPPTYGAAHSGSPLPVPGGAPVWLGELNLDPRSRASASAGSQVVQHNQEALVASAWDQLGEIRKANQLLRQAQLARQVSTSMSQRHLERVAGDGKWLQITAPLHSRVSVKLAGVTATMYGQIQASRVPPASLSPAMRRITRPGGPIGRQLKAGVPQIVDRLNMPTGSTPTAIQAAGPVPPPRGMVALDDVSPDIQVKNMTASAVASAGGWKLATAVIAGTTSTLSTSTGPAAPAQPVTHAGTVAHPELAAPVGPVETGRPVSVTGPISPVVKPPLIDWKANPNLPDILKVSVAYLPPPIVFPSDTVALEVIKTSFRTTAASINTHINTAPAVAPDAAPLGGQAALAPARVALLGRLKPADTIRARLGARIPLGTGADPLQPMQTGPRYPQPMYVPLAQLSPEWMLPGVSEVPLDCASLLAANAAFIEAYMVGLNDEFARELLWREFPADRRFTFFQNFWGAPTQDIGPISVFDKNAHLGGNIVSALSSAGVVFLVRATLFQRYPNAMVFAAKAAWVNGVRQLTDTVQYPVFRGEIGQDVTFFGFNNIDDPKGSEDPAAAKPGWYFVIAEHVTEPRVGLEPGKSSASTGLWNDLSWEEVALKGNYLD